MEKLLAMAIVAWNVPLSGRGTRAAAARTEHHVAAEARTDFLALIGR